MLPVIQQHLALKSNDITLLLESALQAGWRAAFRTFKPTSAVSDDLSEPDFVNGIFSASIPMIDSGLKLIFRGSGISVSASGVFCHQSPKVRLSKKPRKLSTDCELGDILFVFFYRDGLQVVHNALLFQIKFERNKSISPWEDVDMDKGDPQFLLYNEWPAFQYLDKKSMKRQVTGGMHTGAQYGIISYDNPPWRPFWLAAYSAMAAHGATIVPLGAEIFDALFGHSGRPFAEKSIAIKGNDWDAVIWDLLTDTANKTFNLKSSQVSQGKRGSLNLISGSANPPHVMKFLCAMSEQDLANAWSQRKAAPPPELLNPDAQDPPEEPSGISTIFIDLVTSDRSI